jgi:hypothetical protein
MRRGDRLELGAIDRALGVGREVQERDLAAVAFGAQGPQHRHHGSDAAAGTDQQHARGALVGKVEVALRLLQRQDEAGPGGCD